MKQTDSINRNKIKIQLIAINRKQTDSINRNNRQIHRNKQIQLFN